TSAPSSAIILVQEGPATCWVKSSTRMPSRICLRFISCAPHRGKKGMPAAPALAGAAASVMMAVPDWSWSERGKAQPAPAATPSFTSPTGATMDFAYSDKVRELQMRVQEFMDTHITPNEALYYQQ